MQEESANSKRGVMPTPQRTIKIGIISDTHKKSEVAREAIKILKEHGADMLLHAGDIVEKRTLWDLRDSGLPYAATLGNNDDHLAKLKGEFELFDEPYRFEFGGVKFKLMHHPKFLTPDSDVIVFGHTHSFVAGVKQGSLFVNPGEICGWKFINFTFALIEIEGKKFRAFKFIKTPNDAEFQKTEVEIRQFT